MQCINTDVDVTDFLLGKISLLGRQPPDPSIHAFGLIPLFLFLYGLSTTLFTRQKTTWGHAALATCGLFFLFKNFPVFGNYFCTYRRTTPRNFINPRHSANVVHHLLVPIATSILFFFCQSRSS